MLTLRIRSSGLLSLSNRVPNTHISPVGIRISCEPT